MCLQNENTEGNGETQQCEGAEWLQLAGNPKPKLYPQMNFMPCSMPHSHEASNKRGLAELAMLHTNLNSFWVLISENNAFQLVHMTVLYIQAIMKS